jgi:hypothetical protein
MTPNSVVPSLLLLLLLLLLPELPLTALDAWGE